MEKIHLFNRDEADLNLVSGDGINWFFEVDDAHKYILEYMRCGYKDLKVDKQGNIPADSEIVFVDPAGGPFLQVEGYIDKHHKIEKITHVKGKGFCIITNNITK